MNIFQQADQDSKGKKWKGGRAFERDVLYVRRNQKFELYLHAHDHSHLMWGLGADHLLSSCPLGLTMMDCTSSPVIITFVWHNTNQHSLCCIL